MSRKADKKPTLVDVPGESLRRQFEVNVIGPMLLTQGIAKRMAVKKRGKIVFMSSVAGLIVDPFLGAYCASKHAIEALADTLSMELKEFGIEVATINPEPFLTGFNDRTFDAWKSWKDDPSKRLFNYEKLAFPHPQYDPEPVYATTVGVIAGEIERCRNVEPKAIIPQQRQQMDAVWDRKTTDQLGKRPAVVQQAYDLEPETPVS